MWLMMIKGAPDFARLVSGNRKGDEFMDKKQLDVSQVKESKAKKKWQKPKLEDVSGKVMAQPYIRFT